MIQASTQMSQLPFTPIFVPGNRPLLFTKAALSGAEAIIFDLEDAVSEVEKASARDCVADHDVRSIHCCVRINSVSTRWFESDLEMVQSGHFHSVMLPKCETKDEVAAVRAKLALSVRLITLIESALGLANLPQLLATDSGRCPIDMLAFGSIDFALDVGCAHEWEPLQHARSQLVLASRTACLSAPLDGVTPDVSDEIRIESDARRASQFGFGGKLLIHPRQLAAARAGFMPTPESVDWARRVVATSASGNAAQLDGEMIDRPVLLRAQRILAKCSVFGD